VLVDCLTLWLTQRALPLERSPASPHELRAAINAVVASVEAARGPVVLVSNEIGLGVSPLSTEVRTFIDALGFLHQAVAAICERVTLTVAGCELTVRGTAP
jgi:adenosylcobinamide kinase/adenosylcobinamide-phosphate guanylyltransferase